MPFGLVLVYPRDSGARVSFKYPRGRGRHDPNQIFVCGGEDVLACNWRRFTGAEVLTFSLKTPDVDSTTSTWGISPFGT